MYSVFFFVLYDKKTEQLLVLDIWMNKKKKEKTSENISMVTGKTGHVMGLMMSSHPVICSFSLPEGGAFVAGAVCVWVTDASVFPVNAVVKIASTEG